MAPVREPGAPEAPAAVIAVNLSLRSGACKALLAGTNVPLLASASRPMLAAASLPLFGRRPVQNREGNPRPERLGLTGPTSNPRSLASLPGWLQRWNFIERARLERQLWEAFERGENLEALVEGCREAVASGEPDAAFRLEIWQATLVRIRKLEAVMRQQRPPGKGEPD